MTVRLVDVEARLCRLESENRHLRWLVVLLLVPLLAVAGVAATGGEGPMAGLTRVQQDVEDLKQRTRHITATEQETTIAVGLRCRAVFQYDGNIVIYTVRDRRPVWSADTDRVESVMEKCRL